MLVVYRPSVGEISVLSVVYRSTVSQISVMCRVLVKCVNLAVESDPMAFFLSDDILVCIVDPYSMNYGQSVSKVLVS